MFSRRNFLKKIGAAGLFPTGADDKHTLYDQAQDFFQIGSRALYFQGATNGNDPVKIEPWAWGQQITFLTDNQFYTTLQDDWNLTVKPTVEALYFGFVQASVSNSASALMVLTFTCNKFSKIASSLFQDVAFTPIRSSVAGFFSFQSQYPMMFNYADMLVSGGSAPTGVAMNFYGVRVSP